MPSEFETVITDQTQYGTIITTQGAAMIAQCILEGKKLPIVEAAAGDADGAYYQPTVDQTALKGEKWRGQIVSATLNSNTPNMLDVKIVIGEDVGGFTIREMALFDSDGNMIAICNTPATEKVMLSGNVSGKLTMLMHLLVADASVLEFTITPSLDTVTRQEMDAALEASLSNKAPLNTTLCFKSNIAAEMDMNDFIENGVYNLMFGSDVPQISNLPGDYGNRAGVCIVAKSSQLLISYGDKSRAVSAMWARVRYIINSTENWTDWQRLATTGAPEEYNLPFASGWEATLLKCAYWKNQFGEVGLTFAARTTAEVKTNSAIVTLPSGFRPTAQTPVQGALWYVDSHIVGMAEIVPNGTILYTGKNNLPAGSVLIISGSFLAASFPAASY